MINQPRNQRYGSLNLKWRNTFATARNKQFRESQKVIDSEVLRLSDPMTPRKEGYLIKDGVRNTELGTGIIKYKLKYAKRLYYNPQFNFRGKPTRGAYWFERMKKKYKDIILRKAGRSL